MLASACWLALSILGAPPGDSWTCQGVHLPPGAEYDYEVAYTPDGPGAEERATEKARAKLAERLCGGSAACEPFRAEIKSWKTGRGSGRVCAMVTIRKAVAHRLRRELGTTEPLDAGLLDGARRLAQKLASRKGRPPAVRVGAIDDRGLRGGQRADWIASRMEAALGRAGLALSRKASKAGVVVTARLIEREEEGVPILDVAWEAVARGVKLPLPPVSCALRAVPGGASAVLGGRQALYTDPGLTLEVETGRAGRLCEGDRTQITLRADTDVHVRVFDLYGASGALLIFPNEQVPSDRVRAGVPVALGGASAFDVILSPGTDQERYLGVAATRPEELGALGRLRGTCRADAELAAALRDGPRSGLPAAARLAEMGFRVVRKGCRALPSAQTRQRLEEELRKVPICR